MTQDPKSPPQTTVSVERCPFCGSAAASDEFNGREPFEFRYICENKACQAWGPEKPTREGALEAWNERASAAAPADGVLRDRFWLIVHEVGMVPVRKGPWRHTEFTKVMREFIAANPTAYLHVLTIDPLGDPQIDHGPELLQMADGRSMGVGRKHNARTLAAHRLAAGRTAIASAEGGA